MQSIRVQSQDADAFEVYLQKNSVAAIKAPGENGHTIFKSQQSLKLLYHTFSKIKKFQTQKGRP